MYIKYLRIALFMIFLSACGANGGATSSPISPTSPIIAETTPTLVTPSMNTKTPSADLSDLDPIAARMVQKAREHLAKKFGVAEDQISLFSVQATTWSDTGLGCPQQGISYAQMETPGYMILLEAAGKTYNYHTDQNESVIFCEAQGPGEIFLPPNP